MKTLQPQCRESILQDAKDSMNSTINSWLQQKFSDPNSEKSGSFASYSDKSTRLYAYSFIKVTLIPMVLYIRVYFLTLHVAKWQSLPKLIQTWTSSQVCLLHATSVWTNSACFWIKLHMNQHILYLMEELFQKGLIIILFTCWVVSITNATPNFDSRSLTDF